MRVFQNVAIGVAVVLVAMACMVFGDWLARGKRQPNYYYCQNASTPESSEITALQEGTTPNQKEARETANQRKHELCQQWRAAQAAEEAARVAWIQLWFGLAGLAGLGLTVYFAAQSAKAASEAARETARAVDVQVRIEQPLLMVDGLEITSNRKWVNLRIHNYGKTPAVLVKVYCDLEVTPSIPSEPTYSGILHAGRDVVLASEASWASSVPLFKQPSLDAALSGELPAYLWGLVVYEDVIGRLRFYGFCFQGAGNKLLGGIELMWERYGGTAYNYDHKVERQQPREEPLAFAPKDH